MTWNTNERAAATYAARHAAPEFDRVGLADAVRYVTSGLGIDDLDAPAFYEAQADLMAYLASTGEKVDDQFVYDDEERGNLNIGISIVWALHTVRRDGDRTFEFVREMANAAVGRGLSAGQIRGLLNCMRADALREARLLAEAEPFTDEPEDAPATQAAEFAPVVATMQRLAASLSRPKVRLAEDVVLSVAGPRSKNPGSITVAGQRYGDRYFGRVDLDGTTTVTDADALTLLRAFALDPEAALATYGRLTGQCGICGRRLENAESVALGIGPICRGKMGL